MKMEIQRFSRYIYDQRLFVQQERKVQMSHKHHKGQQTFDIILWGATGFVGKILADWLWPRYGKTDKIRLALGGNNRPELEALREELKADHRLPLIVGDALDRPFLDAMVKKAAVIVSTVGPYAQLGSELVAACAANGTDYCDLSGETQWMRRMIDAHQKTAESSGARIVHACGFDSIPSDMGVYFLQNEAMKRFGHPMQQVKMRIKSMRGGFSGGTVASILNIVEEARRDRETIKIMKNPYALAPEGMRDGVRQPGVAVYEYDPDSQSWVAPFVMAAVNTRVVHRSNALTGYAWGKDFKYDEALMTGPGLYGRLRAAAVAGATGAFLMGGAIGPARTLLKMTLLPKPGEGPSAEKRKLGFFKLHFTGSAADGNRLNAIVTGDSDPGYGSTPKMLGESAVCLLKDISKDDMKGGFWTPSTAMGETLLHRLTDSAGLTFSIAET